MNPAALDALLGTDYLNGEILPVLGELGVPEASQKVLQDEIASIRTPEQDPVEASATRITHNLDADADAESLVSLGIAAHGTANCLRMLVLAWYDPVGSGLRRIGTHVSSTTGCSHLGAASSSGFHLERVHDAGFDDVVLTWGVSYPARYWSMGFEDEGGTRVLTSQRGRIEILFDWKWAARGAPQEYLRWSDQAPKIARIWALRVPPGERFLKEILAEEWEYNRESWTYQKGAAVQ